MSKLRVFTSEYSMPVGFGQKTFKVVGSENTIIDSNDLIFAANNDAISFIMLYHLGLFHNSTFIWLPSHSIEKFLKAYLLARPSYNEQKIRKFDHNIKKLWREYKSEYKYPIYPNIEEYISEISCISPSIRYGDKKVALNDNLLSGFVYLLVHFNKFKRGSENYHNSYYGFFDNEIPDINISSKGILSSIIKSYLHLIIEHQVTLSPTGICHPHKYEEVKLLKQGRLDEKCPLCNHKAKLDILQCGLSNQDTCELVRNYLNR